jgi:hypothetical protein
MARLPVPMVMTILQQYNSRSCMPVCWTPAGRQNTVLQPVFLSPVVIKTPQDAHHEGVKCLTNSCSLCHLRQHTSAAGTKAAGCCPGSLSGIAVHVLNT